MAKDFYKMLTLAGWVLLVCSVIQIFLFPIFIFPLPFLYIPTAILFLIAAFAKKMETAFPSYLNNDKESFIYNLKFVSYALYIAAVLPLVLGIYNYMTMETDPSFWRSLINLFGLGLTTISVLILFITGYAIKMLNYGTKNLQVYTIGYNTSNSAGRDSEEYNSDADYREENDDLH
ncbi:hypothetical protein MmiAt1_12250 [Methanimicrococcus sp. At1]|uniref:Uncharacterized protein n=1 Tax=Methanimicrococcus hacksteinii TaxID=3028293 RepID=A0ABU3VQF2_9EURY|nr:hypothetical protein [Methanimicrococcus sp. At1]MDV0445636.1 hypothetical protein [Methanimicrococcus sp. At1]